MSDAILRPYRVQNSEIFQEQIHSQIGANKNGMGMNNNTLKHPQVAVYLRCSTEDQSVAAQRMSLGGFLRFHGIEIDECNFYIDEGVSAKKYPSFTDRPDGSRLMEDIAAGKITQLFGFKVDRFFRRMEQGSAWMNTMKKSFPHVSVITSDCNASLQTSAGRKWWHFSLLLAEDENEARAERTTGGMQFKSERLEKTSHSVFGWEEYDSGERNITQGRDKGALIKMRPCWHEMAVRNWILENPDGLSANKIASKLNQWGIPTATGRLWSASTVRSQKSRPAKLHEQIHQFEEPKRMLHPPFRNFVPANRF